jgi:hypothetical protein
MAESARMVASRVTYKISIVVASRLTYKISMVVASRLTYKISMVVASSLGQLASRCRSLKTASIFHNKSSSG